MERPLSNLREADKIFGDWVRSKASSLLCDLDAAPGGPSLNAHNPGSSVGSGNFLPLLLKAGTNSPRKPYGITNAFASKPAELQRKNFSKRAMEATLLKGEQMRWNLSLNRLNFNLITESNPIQISPSQIQTIRIVLLVQLSHLSQFAYLELIITSD